MQCHLKRSIDIASALVYKPLFQFSLSRNVYKSLKSERIGERPVHNDENSHPVHPDSPLKSLKFKTEKFKPFRL